jgi:hypothetical protein
VCQINLDFPGSIRGLSTISSEPAIQSVCLTEAGMAASGNIKPDNKIACACE